MHHRRSIRLKEYDYLQVGAYFVTICTHNRECLFGDINNGEMKLNNAGRVVRNVWNNLPAGYFNIETDEFVVMPNHIHGIILIVGAQFIAPDGNQNTTNQDVINQGAMNRAPTLGEIVRTSKVRCTHAINRINNTVGVPLWQRNYYEHIIRNEAELNKTREYIVNNPLNWESDENFANRT
jgi:REP element-mobilizing transposase RayT